MNTTRQFEPGYFTVLALHRDDFANADGGCGWDASKLTDGDMARISSKLGDIIMEGGDFWLGVEELAKAWRLPKLEHFNYENKE